MPRVAALALLLFGGLAHAGDELDVLILDDGGAATADLKEALEDLGHSVVLSSDEGVYEYDFISAVGDYGLSDFDAVIWLDGFEAADIEMDARGQSFLAGFVEAGGGLLHLGDTSAAAAAGGYGGVGELLLLEADAYFYGAATFEVLDADHRAVADYGDGDTFSVSGAPLMTGSTDAAVALSWTGSGVSEQPALMSAEVGEGRVVQLAWLGGYQSGGYTYTVPYGDSDVQAVIGASLQYLAQRAPEVTWGSDSYTVYAEQSLTLSLEAVDHDGGEVSCDWDLDYDGEYGEAYGTSAEWSAAGYNGDATGRARVQCEDDEGRTTTEVAVISVLNVDPVVEALSVSGTLSEGESLTFNAEASDIEGDRLTLYWDFGDGETGERDGARHSYVDDGSYVVTLTVDDGDGGVVSETLDLVIANAAPGASLSYAPLYNIREGDEVSFTGSSSDDGAEDVLSFSWDFGDGGSSSEQNPTWSYTQQGTYEVTLTVTDGDGGTGTATAEIDIANRGPSAELTGPGEGAQGESLDFACNATDPGDDELTWSWSFGDGETAEGSDEVSHAYTTPGTYTVSCTVSDGDQDERTTLSVQIVNAPPVFTEVEVPAGDEGAELIFRASAEDPGGDAVSYSWDFGDGATAEGAEVSHAYADDGEYTVTAVASDGADESEEVLTASIANVAPEIVGSPSVVAWPGVEYGYSPSADEPGDDTLTWSADLPDGATVDSASGVVRWTPGSGEEGSFELSLTVSDGDGGEDTVSWTVSVGGSDSDGDGMADDWEAAAGLDPDDASDAGEDPDGDGKTNLDEFLGGTDPGAYGGPGVPEPLTPLDGEELAITTPTAACTNTTDGDGDPLDYYFELYADEALTALVAESGPIPEDEGVTAWVPGELTENQDYWWRVSAWDGWTSGGWSEAQGFFVNATEEPPGPPELLRPWEGSTLDLSAPEFELNPAVDPDRDGLTHYVSITDTDDVELGVAEASERGGVLVAEAPGAMGEGSWCWTAWAVDEHGLEGELAEPVCFVAVEGNQAPGKPELLYPEGGSEISETRPEILIADGVDPEGAAIYHHFELDVVGSFDSPELQQAFLPSDGDGTTGWIPEIALAVGGYYYLRVASDDGVVRSDWVVASFSVRAANEPPEPPGLVYPADGAVVLSQPVELIASDAYDPEGTELRYQFELLDDSDQPVFAALDVEEGAEGTTSVQVFGLLEGVNYRWRARAIDAEGAEGDWSEEAGFTLDEIEPREDEDGGSELKGCGCGATGRPSQSWLTLALLSGAALRRRRR